MNDFSNKFDKKDSSQLQTIKTENSFQRTSSTAKQFNLNCVHNGKFSENESLSYNVKTKLTEDSQFDNTDYFSDTNSFKSLKHSHKSNANGIKYSKPDSLVSSRQQNSIQNSNQIDCEKYYKMAKDGTYILHFANKKELSSDEISKLFSPYGSILSLYKNEDKPNGLVFIRYKTLAEIEACLIGLQNSDVISILRQKNQINGTDKRTDQRSSNQSAGIQDTFQGICNTGEQLHSNSNYDKEFLRAKEKSIINTISNETTFDNTNNFEETSGVSAIIQSNLLSRKQLLLASLKQNVNYEVFKHNQEQQQNDKSVDLSKPDANTCKNKDLFDKMSTKILEKKQKNIDRSVQELSRTKTSSKITIIPMEEIIVANIHSNYDAHYILHLFRKYNPISATLAEKIVGTNIRYCHIYFKTKHDALAIEEEFDNFCLSGKNLIVLQTGRLKEEAVRK
ncbi:uncharacterized protein LOC114938175 [Nylanderia fulva]|uniref:uncharacterized protein LOC114938175 n=1 Tax=Nylanderia fulva TaxID=613905 RepID=UPI0010FB3ACB|nr:uncharacterized protein LOC114938175 [Nylanderia fulva]